MRGVWLPNIKRWLTGTTVGASQALDVNIVAGASGASPTFKEYRFQDANVTQINGSGGVFVQIGDSGHAASDIANSIAQMKVANNTGAAIIIAAGANAAAAAAATPLAVVHAGQTSEAVYTVSLVATNKIWVRALQTSDIVSGELLVTLY